MTAQQFVEELKTCTTMGQSFALAKRYSELPPVEIEKLLRNSEHNVRVGAVSIMDWQARDKKKKIAHAATMPRTALRYTIEHLEPAEREHYLRLKGTRGGKG